MMIVRVMVIVAVLFGLAAPAAAELLVYAPPPAPAVYGYHNDDYTVRVRAPGGDWQDLYEYKIRVDWDHPQDASLVYFDFTGTVELEIEKNNGGFSTVSLAPLSTDAKFERRGQTVHIVLTHPQKFSVQFNDDRLHNLHVLAGAPPPPVPSGADVHVFGPGLHAPVDGSGRFPVKSGDTVYLAGGAILKGSFAIEDLHDVRIMGRGLIYDPGAPIDLNHARNVRLSGFILVNGDTQPAARIANIRNSENVRLDDVSGFTSGKWSDGVNISASQHVAINHAYLRTSDDAVVVYAVTDCPICATTSAADGPPGQSGPADTFDVKVTNSILWADVAHAMYVGHFGDNAAPRTIHDIVFDTIDVVNLDEDDPDWEGVMAIFSGDSTLIRDVHFRNIHVDRIEEGKLIHVETGNNSRYNRMPGRGVQDVSFENIRFTGEGMPGLSIISGQSERSAVSGVRIEHLTIGDRPIMDLPSGDIRVGPFVKDVTIR